MNEMPSAGTAELESDDGGPPALRLRGDWTLPHYRVLADHVAQLQPQVDAGMHVDLAALGAIDTAGAGLLARLLGAERLRSVADATELPRERRALFDAVAAALEQREAAPEEVRGSAIGDLFAHIGSAMLAIGSQVVALLGFIGLTLESAFHVLPRPRRWRLTAFAANLERTGLDAVPIVALLTFLVGAVIAFLGATVLTAFGAGIYTVDLVAFSYLREFGVLLTAILVAGRTASAFAAQIGSMKANEEIDAIRVQGLDPIELLVLPRVAALLVGLPLLTFIAMIAGIVGGMLVCRFELNISTTLFFSVIDSDVQVRHFFVGMVKAPIFAFLIAVIGCLEGFKVSGSAQSVGEHTTSAVVQSIFVVILVDAIAALVCMEMKW